MTLEIVGLAVSGTSLGSLLAVSTVDNFLGELGRVVGEQLVKGLLLLGFEVGQVVIHLVVGVDVVHALLARDVAGLNVLDLVVDIAVSVVAIPVSSGVEVGLDSVQSAEKVQLSVLVGLISRQS